MYDSLLRADDVIGDDLGPESILFHRGDYQSVLRRYHQFAERAAQDGVRGVRDLAPELSSMIADARTLRQAWDHLARNGGSAPGPDGLRYSDLTSEEAWDLCRCLAKVIRSGTYGRGPDRIVMISKGPGRGERPLVLSNIADRVVERAVLTVLQPLLDPLFDEYSFGYRPARGPLDALALAERFALKQRRRVWLVDDIKDAFVNVPLARLLQVIRKLLPDDRLIDLIERVLAGSDTPGLRQGGPLSPLLLNVYLNHFLDRPWRRDHPTLPLIRVADDMLVPCRSAKEASTARVGLEHLLQPAGMELKWSEQTGIHDLVTDTIDWIGFSIHKATRGLSFDIGEKAWERLDEQLGLAHAKCDSTLRAPLVITGWIGQRGPCYRRSAHEGVCDRISNMAARHAFDELLDVQEWRDVWRAAYERWQRLREDYRRNLQSSGSQRDRHSIGFR